MKKRTMLFTFAAIVLVLALTACGGSAEAPIGDSAAGETLFAQTIIGTQPGCNTCHSLTPDEVVVGPSMAGIATRAETRVAGQSAEDYIRESILEPNNYVVDDFQPGIMIQVWEDELSADQLDNLVAYLLTLK